MNVIERALAGSPMTLVDCGCLAYVYRDGSGIEIEYCRLHAAAPILLEACKALYEQLQHIATHDPHFTDGKYGSEVLPPLFLKAQAAIRAAKGGSQ